MLKFIVPLFYAVCPSMVYSLARRRIEEIIPFNRLLGIEIVSVGDGVGEARLPFRRDLRNHIGSMHATAIFGIAEAASGCAMTGAFVSEIMNVRPVASSTQVKFLRVAKTDLVAHARTTIASEDLRSQLAKEGSISFDVEVNVQDSTGRDVALVIVAWHLKPLKKLKSNQ